MARARESDSHGPTWQVQAALIARRFYLEGQAKVEIADELGLSRFKVARILEEARELGLVEVRVRLPSPIDPDLSAALQAHLGLRRGIVVGSSPEDSEASVREGLGRVAAELLTELVTDEDVLGLTCSRTVAATTHALRSLDRCPIVQLTGTMAGPEIEVGSVESVRRASVVGGGKAFPIYAPMVLADAATALALSSEPAIGQVFERFSAVSVALVAVGGWEARLSTVWETVGPREHDEARRAGTVGEIGARLFDADGRPVRTSLDERVLGVTLEQLRAVPEVVGLAYASGRAEAVHAAVRGRLVNSLVCDAPLAQRLLELESLPVGKQGASA